MLRITNRLRRIRYTRVVVQLLIWIVLLPFIILFFLGKASECIIDKASDIYIKLERKVVKRYNLDEVARKQYATNPEKFKYN